MTSRASSALGAAVERAITGILEKGIPDGERPVEFTDKEWDAVLAEAPEGADAVDPLIVTGRRDDEWSRDTFFHVSSKRSSGAMESFFLGRGREVTPGVVAAVFEVPRELRLSSAAGNPLAEPHDLASSLDFWRVAAVHSR